MALTNEMLDGYEADYTVTGGGAMLITNEHMHELLRLARRGLRAERETCGRCGHFEGEGEGTLAVSVCNWRWCACSPTDYCSSWRSRERGEE